MDLICENYFEKKYERRIESFEKETLLGIFEIIDKMHKHSIEDYKNVIDGYLTKEEVGGTVASWLARSTPERALRVRALAGDIVLCSWARHFTLTVPLSTQVYKWVPANLMLGGNPAMD